MTDSRIYGFTDSRNYGTADSRIYTLRSPLSAPASHAKVKVKVRSTFIVVWKVLKIFILSLRKFYLFLHF